MHNAELVHTQYLLEWMKPKHIIDVGINMHDLVSIISEPIWFDDRNHKGEQHTICDYILLYSDGTASSGELKGSQCQRQKAKKQLISGNIYITEVLQRDPISSLFLVYHEGYYSHEWMDLR